MADETLNLPSAEAIGKLSPEAKASAQSAFQRAYPFRKAEIEAAFSAKAEPVTPPPKPTSGETEAYHSPADAGLSYDQRLRGYRALLKHATDKVAVIESAKRAGIDLSGGVSTDAILAELNSQGAQEAKTDPLIQHGVLTVPETPSGYRLRYERDDIGALTPEQLHRLDTETRQAFHAAGVPAILAQSLMRAMFDAAGRYADLSDVEREIEFRSEGAKLRRMTGSEKAAHEIGRKASAMYERLPVRFRQQVDNEYGWHSAQAQLALAKTWDAVALREARAKK